MSATRLTKEEVVQMYERAKAGEPIRELASEFGIARGTAYQLLRRRFGYQRGALGDFTNYERQMPTDPATLAYAAGLIDGEGSIVPVIQHRSSPVYHVKMGMITPEPIAWMHEQFGGKHYIWHDNRIGGRRLPLHTWKLTPIPAVAEFLELVVPYMLLPEKLSRAEAAIELCRSRAESFTVPPSTLF